MGSGPLFDRFYDARINPTSSYGYLTTYHFSSDSFHYLGVSLLLRSDIPQIDSTKFEMPCYYYLHQAKA